MVGTGKHSQFAHMTHAALVAPGNKFPRKPKQVFDGGLNDARAVRNTSADKKWSMSAMLDEACRVPEASKHVERPVEPLWLIGSRAAVESRARAWHCQATKVDGKSRLQLNSPVVNCIVVSMNRELESEWPLYRGAVVEHLVKENGVARVVGAVEHNDEAHMHIHVFLVPLAGEEFGVVHASYAEHTRLRRTLRLDTPKIGTILRKAYVAEMVAWQDRLHQATTHVVSIKRLGPQRERLTRSVHNIIESAKTEAIKNADVIHRKAEAVAAAAADEFAHAAIKKAEANRLLRQAAEAKYIISWARRNFDEAPAGQHHAERAADQAQIASLIAELQKTKRQLGVYTNRDERILREALIIQVDEHGNQTSDAEIFAASTQRATMRPPRKPTPGGSL